VSAKPHWSTRSSKSFGAKTVAIAPCAPTGRAAKRLSETTGLEAKTILRLLETDPQDRRFPAHRGGTARLVDVPLMRALLRVLPDQAALLLVGDVDQLLSVGPGQVLADIIASGAMPLVCLTEVFRQAAESHIIVNAHRINQGLIPELAPAAKRTPARGFFDRVICFTLVASPTGARSYR
jgi:exodeoxyribonuclease V alpha subunit